MTVAQRNAFIKAARKFLATQRDPHRREFVLTRKAQDAAIALNWYMVTCAKREYEVLCGKLYLLGFKF